MMNYSLHAVIAMMDDPCMYEWGTKKNPTQKMNLIKKPPKEDKTDQRVLLIKRCKIMT